jgi:hypothetical protein
MRFPKCIRIMNNNLYTGQTASCNVTQRITFLFPRELPKKLGRRREREREKRNMAE